MQNRSSHRSRRSRSGPRDSSSRIQSALGVRRDGMALNTDGNDSVGEEGRLVDTDRMEERN